MPSYQWIVPRDSVPFEKRQEVALACTDIHCGSTGAPRSFVQVTFHEYYGESEHDTPYFLDAGNRAGRPTCSAPSAISTTSRRIWSAGDSPRAPAAGL